MVHRHSIVTVAGRNKEAAKTAVNQPVVFTEIALGSGNRYPAGGETTLQTEVYRGQITGSGVEAGEPNAVWFDLYVPANVNTFYTQEIGLFDEDGVLYALSRFDQPVPKFGPDSTALSDNTYRIVVIFADTENVVVHLDPVAGITSSTLPQHLPWATLPQAKDPEQEERIIDPKRLHAVLTGLGASAQTLQAAGDLGLRFLTDASTPAEYPFAAGVQNGDLVYLFRQADTSVNPAIYIPVEYRKALDRDNGINSLVAQAGQQVHDYTLLSNSVIGFADIDDSLIWSGSLPDHVRPQGLAANKEWWLSDAAAGGVRDSQPFANRDPVGFTEENGYFIPYASFLIELFQPRLASNTVTIVAEQGEDVSHRVRKALRRYRSVQLFVPEGITASITHSRIDVSNRILLIVVNGTLNCEHRVKHSPFLNSGDWFQVSAFMLGGGGSLAFSGKGTINHNVGDVGAGNLAPNNIGLVSGLPHTQGATPVPASLSVFSYDLKIYLSTSMLNHEGGGSHFSMTCMGCDFFKKADALAAVPKIVTKGSWQFFAGTVSLAVVSVAFNNSITRGTSGNADGVFSFGAIDDRAPGFFYG